MPPSPKENFTDEDKALLTEEELAHLDDDLNDDVAADEPEAAAAAAEAAKEAEDRAAEAKKAEDDQTAADKAAADKAKADADAQKAADDLAAQKAAADAGDEAAKQAIADREKAEADAKAAADAEAAKKAEDDAAATPRAMDGIKERSPKMVEADLEKIDVDLDAIAAKFDEGDITAVEMRKQQSDLLKQQRELTVELTTSVVSSKTWREKTVPGWLDKHPEYKADPELMAELDKTVRAAQATAGRQYDPSFLENAHKTLAPKVEAVKLKITAAEEATVRKVLGLGPNDPLPKKAGNGAAASTVKDPAARVIPPTLGKVPAADINTDDGGKYAALERLASKNPLAYEAELAKMSDADREAYLAQ